MAATKLVLHHRYRDDIAYDWSQHGNHGTLLDVANGPPSGLQFDQPASQVHVKPSDTLRNFGELRVRVVFLPRSIPGVARFELVEAHEAFALYRNEDLSLMGTINSPSAGWLGPITPPGAVIPDRWHTADFTHDGVSRARLYLDGALVAERLDVAGPIPNMGPHELHIGHWPEGDDYTLIGQLDEVQIWKDDPEKEAKRVVDDCCIDNQWIDQRFDEARRRGWVAADVRDRFLTFFADARAAAAEVRGGNAARIAQINALTQQAMTALTTRQTTGLETTLGTLLNLAVAEVGQTRLEQIGRKLLDDLRATPLGDWMGSTDEETVAFFEELVDHSCLGEALPERPRDREPRPGDHPPERLPERDPRQDTLGDLPWPSDPPDAHEHVDVPPGVDPHDPFASPDVTPVPAPDGEGGPP